MGELQFRRGTEAAWSASNPVLDLGEPGLAWDTGILKMGDGESVWTALDGISVSGLASFAENIGNTAGTLRVVADNGWGTGYQSTTSVGTGELFFTIGSAVSAIAPLFQHFYTAGTVPHTDTYPTTSIVFKASVWVVSSSNPNTVLNTIYPLTFGGRLSPTLDPGGQIVADPLGINLLPGDKLAVRTYLASGTAYIPRTTASNNAPGSGGFTATTDLTPTGSAAIADSSGSYYAPAAILGCAAPGSLAVLGEGDSIMKGTGDGYVAGTIFSGRTSNEAVDYGGFLTRALTGKAGLLNTGVSADRLYWFVGTGDSLFRSLNARRCSTAVSDYGTNDFADGQTVAQLQENHLTRATQLRALGITKYFVTTITPRTSSTDGWATTTNQTPSAIESNRVIYNTWLRAGSPINPTTLLPVAVGTANALYAGSFGHPFTGFFDVASKVETALNSGLWLPCQRVVNDATGNVGQTVTSATAAFVNSSRGVGGDLATTFSLAGAGAAGALYIGYVNVVSSTTQCIVLPAMSTAVSGAQLALGVMTIDGLHPSTRGHDLASQAIDVTQL